MSSVLWEVAELPSKSHEKEGSFDTNVDHYPTAVEAFTRLAHAERLPEGQVEYIQVHAMANGELSWTIRRARVEEADVGLDPAPE